MPPGSWLQLSRAQLPQPPPRGRSPGSPFNLLQLLDPAMVTHHHTRTSLRAGTQSETLHLASASPCSTWASPSHRGTLQDPVIHSPPLMLLPSATATGPSFQLLLRQLMRSALSLTPHLSTPQTHTLPSNVPVLVSMDLCPSLDDSVFTKCLRGHCTFQTIKCYASTQMLSKNDSMYVLF